MNPTTNGGSPVVVIESDIRPDLGYIIINESDFDPTKHKLYDPTNPKARPLTSTKTTKPPTKATPKEVIQS